MILPPVDDMDFSNAVGERVEAELHLGNHSAGDDARLDERLGLRRGQVERIAPSAPLTPGTSVSSTSFSARMAAASLAANGSALTLSERPS